MYMNNFEMANWPHIIRKGKNMLGQVWIIAEEMKNKQNKSQQPHRGGLKEYKLTKVFKWFQTAPTAYLRSLKDKVRNKIEQKGKVPQYLSGVRKKKRNGN